MQGPYAFVSTLTVTAIAQWMYMKSGGGIKGIVVGLLVSYVMMALIPFSVHSIAATPDRIQTILLGLVIGAMYLAGFLLMLEKNRLKKIIPEKQVELMGTVLS